MNNKYALSMGSTIALATCASSIHVAYSLEAERRALINQNGLNGTSSMPELCVKMLNNDFSP